MRQEKYSTIACSPRRLRCFRASTSSTRSPSAGAFIATSTVRRDSSYAAAELKTLDAESCFPASVRKIYRHQLEGRAGHSDMQVVDGPDSADPVLLASWINCTRPADSLDISDAHILETGRSRTFRVRFRLESGLDKPEAQQSDYLAYAIHE